MSLREIFKFTIDDIYWFLKAGKSRKKVSATELRSDINKYIQSPIFFISTGRCGTKWFSNLLELNKSSFVLHSPTPSFASQNKLVFETLAEKEISKKEEELVKEIFLAGREQYLRYSYKTQKIYIETNNYISFFAPILIKVFPDAKFVHLYRHPGEFVRSGIRRNYFSKNNPDNIRRITPNHIQMESWEQTSQLEKTAWLWNETNSFIENFKKENQANCYDFNFNELNLENVKSLLNFLEIKIPESSIKKVLNKKSNAQKKGTFAKYKDWSEDQKLELRKICQELSEKYNYTI